MRNNRSKAKPTQWRQRRASLWRSRSVGLSLSLSLTLLTSPDTGENEARPCSAWRATWPVLAATRKLSGRSFSCLLWHGLVIIYQAVIACSISCRSCCISLIEVLLCYWENVRRTKVHTKQLYQHQLHIINNQHTWSRATSPGQVETPMLA